LADEINLVSPAAGAQGAGSRCEIDLLSLYEVSESCQTFHTMFGWAPSYDRGWTGGGRSGGGWGAPPPCSLAQTLMTMSGHAVDAAGARDVRAAAPRVPTG
jgi:hypothetical protein